MKIDVLIRLINILPREAGEALPTDVILKRYYAGLGTKAKDDLTDDAKMRRIQAYMVEMVKTGIVSRIQESGATRGMQSRPRYHLRESQLLSYFLHSKVALNLLWTRGLSKQLDSLAGADDVESMALKARLSERERVLRDRVRVVPDGVGRQFADIESAILRPVVEALETGYELEITARHRDGVVEEFEATVLGLVAKDGAVYMITVRGFDDRPVHYPLHRVKRAAVIKVRAFTRPEFQIDEYIADQHQLAHVLRDEVSPIELDLLVAEEALFHFRERPFLVTTGEQVISEQAVKGKWYSVKATVPYTIMLAPFLWSHAGWVQVLGPESIRKRVADGVLAAAAHYQQLPG
jgi:predicted DNA-binding transcriptional regulator YafY